MKDKLLTDICSILNSKGITDISKSILNPVCEVQRYTGFMNMLEYLPVENLQNVLSALDSMGSIPFDTAELYDRLSNTGALEFRPYLLGNVLVCAVNKFIVYESGHFYVKTSLSDGHNVSVGRGDITGLITRLMEDVSVDCYNAIVAELICTAYMCRGLRDEIRRDGTCITEFLKSILSNCKALPIYSIETFKSRLSWVYLSQDYNNNISVDNTYNISIGDDAVTMEYMSPIGNLSHTGFVFDSSKLKSYDTQYSVKFIYFAYALYLMVSDIFTTEFPYPISTGIHYDKVKSIHELYLR